MAPVPDGGYKSRKLWLTFVAMKLVLLGYIFTATWPAFAPTYGTYVGAIVGLATLYLTGNVATQHVLKAAAPVGAAAPKPAVKPEQSPDG